MDQNLLENIKSVVKEGTLEALQSSEGKFALAQALESSEGQKAIVSALQTPAAQEAIARSLGTEVGQIAIANAMKLPVVKEAMMEIYAEAFQEFDQPIFEKLYDTA